MQVTTRQLVISSHSRGTARVALALFCFAVAFIALCGPAVAQSDAATLVVGQRYDASTAVGGAKAKYKSSKADVATVTSKGVVKAKKAGTAKVTVKASGKKKKTLSVTVYATASKSKPGKAKNALVKQTGSNKLKLSWKKVSKASGYVIYQRIGSKYYPTLVVKGASTTSKTFKKLTANKRYYFRVCAYKKVTVTERVKGKPKKVTKLSLGAKSLKVSALVEGATSTKANATSVSFGRKQITIVAKGTGDCLASIVGPDGKKLVSSAVRYTSSNEKVVTVNDEGVVTSKVKKKKSCKITAWAHNGVHKTITVKVVPSLSVNATTFIGHRGAQDAAPDNTLASFAMAKQEGYKNVELDVWETYSGDLIVNHNQTLNANCGVNIDVRNLSCDPENEHYVGNYRIIAGTNVSSFGTLTVLSFTDAVKICAALDLKMSVHVKNGAKDPITEEGMAKLVEELSAYDRVSTTTIASHLLPTLQLAQEAGIPQTQYTLQSAAGYELSSANFESELKRAADDAKAAGCTVVSAPWKSSFPMDKEAVDYCHSLGLEVCAWTISSKKTACRLIDIGVDALTCSEQLFG